MKVAIYCRLSDEDRNKLSPQNDSESISNQKAMLIQYADSNGWPIYGIYCDDDYSGADRSRPEFNRLIKDARDRKFDIILCKNQSRFTRELELVEKYINGLFPRIGVRFISLVDCADTNNKGNKKSRQINGLVNEWFLEDLSENIRSVLTSRRKQGYHIGAFAPYGYRKDPDMRGHLLIDPEASEVVRRIFELYLEGNGKEKIARTLNDAGIPNPTEYKRLHGIVRNKKTKFSPLWSYVTISSILTNEVYIGNMIQGKSGIRSYKTREKVTYPRDQWITVNGTHESIIEQQTWDRVQARIAEKSTPNQKQPEGVFARKIHCMYCGSRMRAVKSGNKRGFKCDRHAVSHDACIGTYISLPKLERIVLAEVYEMYRELQNEEVSEQQRNHFTELKSRIEDNHSYAAGSTMSKEIVTVLIDHILVGKYDPATRNTPVEIYWNY